MVGKGPCSAEVVKICRDRCSIIIRGNWDDGLAHRTYEPHRMHYWHQQLFTADELAWLGQLPLAQEFWFSGNRVRLIHSTPQRLHVKIPLDRSYDEWLTMFDNTPLLGLDTPTPDILIFGHTHRGHVQNMSKHGRLILNPGSVGNATDGLNYASYMILEGQLHSQVRASYTYQTVRIPYDVDAELQMAIERGMPDFDYYEFELRNAVYRSNFPPYQRMMAARRARAKA